MLILFHYHHHTPEVKEMEKFYIENGYKLILRVGKYKGILHSYSPPVTWDEIENKEIDLSIIEVRQGKVNVTFGYGTETRFDHLGILTTKEEHDEICRRAEASDWKVSNGERRTFLANHHLPFRIELQTRVEVIDSLLETDELSIQQMKIMIKDLSMIEEIARVLGLNMISENEIGTDDWSILFSEGKKYQLKEVKFNIKKYFHAVDPTDVLLKGQLKYREG